MTQRKFGTLPEIDGSVRLSIKMAATLIGHVAVHKAPRLNDGDKLYYRISHAKTGYMLRDYETAHQAKFVAHCISEIFDDYPDFEGDPDKSDACKEWGKTHRDAIYAAYKAAEREWDILHPKPETEDDDNDNS